MSFERVRSRGADGLHLCVQCDLFVRTVLGKLLCVSLNKYTWFVYIIGGTVIPIFLDIV